jgi:hypothetical protein
MRYSSHVPEKPDPVEGTAREGTARPGWLMGLLLVVVVGVVGYVLYSGGALEKISIPGWLEFDFSPKPAVQIHPVASRNFMLGKWEVEQPAGDTSITYYKDGTLMGSETAFAGNLGDREPSSGTWSFKKLSDDTFRLSVLLNGKPPWEGTFRIFDQYHIHNVDTNYVAVRIP